jgi:hypothetical protein
VVFEGVGLDSDFLEASEQMVLTNKPEILRLDRFAVLERSQDGLDFPVARLSPGIQQRSQRRSR